MKISFCLPQQHFPKEVSRQAWEQGQYVAFNDYYGSATHESWIYQTFLFLRNQGLPIDFYTCLVEKGIVLIIGGALYKHLKLAKGVFFVDIVADGDPHPNAHFHIVQNRTHVPLIFNSHYIPHWPQPHLIRRDPSRGNRFENVVFFGNRCNLAPVFHTTEWKDFLHKELGLTFRIHEADRWHDYSDVDCAIAIRDFSESPHLNKPAAKLYNAWHAGVPFIGGRDSAYSSDGEVWKNYLMASSLEETFNHIKRLQVYPELRSKLVAEGDQAGANFTQEATLKQWKELIEVILPRLTGKKGTKE